MDFNTIINLISTLESYRLYAQYREPRRLLFKHADWLKQILITFIHLIKISRYNFCFKKKINLRNPVMYRQQM